jgi:hypothetical protein
MSAPAAGNGTQESNEALALLLIQRRGSIDRALDVVSETLYPQIAAGIEEIRVVRGA